MNLNDIAITNKLRERFDKYVYPDPNSGCFIWAASCNGDGHGRFAICRKEQKAHRVAWVLAGRRISDGLNILHKCDTPCCVNVDHLFEGTDQDNMTDMARKGRGRKSKIGLPFGVARQSCGSGYIAQIRTGGAILYLGTFDTAEKASSVAQAAKRDALAKVVK